jgi:hypothetical protein
MSCAPSCPAAASASRAAFSRLARRRSFRRNFSTYGVWSYDFFLPNFPSRNLDLLLNGQFLCLFHYVHILPRHSPGFVEFKSFLNLLRKKDIFSYYDLNTCWRSFSPYVATGTSEKLSIREAIAHLLARNRLIRPLCFGPARPMNVEWKSRPYFGVFAVED